MRAIRILIVGSALWVTSAVWAANPGWLGFGYTVHRSPNDARITFLFVRQLVPGGPAARAGLHVQDVISAIDGRPVRFADASAALAFFQKVRPRQAIVFTVVQPKVSKSVRVVAAEMPPEQLRRWKENEDLAKQSH